MDTDATDDSPHLIYYPLNFKMWSLFNDVHPAMLEKVELVHIFGESSKLLSAYIVTEEDVVYGIGRNDFGRLGIGDSNVEDVTVPVEIDVISGQRVICFASGAMHTLALTEGGDVYSWGLNTMGPLGNGTIINRDTPGRVLLPPEVKIKAIAAMNSYSVAVTTENEVLQWGDVFFTDCSIQNMPDKIDFPEKITCKQICCSVFNACLLTHDSKVYMWGKVWNSSTDLSYNVDPMCITDPSKHKNIISIACSRDVVIALNEEGKVYMLRSQGLISMIPEPQKRMRVMEIAGAPYSNSPIVFRMGDEGYLRFFPPYETGDTDTKHTMNSIQCAFFGTATPQVYRRSIHKIDGRAHRIQGSKRNICAALFNVKEHSDLTVTLTDGKVYVHKLILVTFCEHFKSMLLGSWAKQNDNTVLDMTNYNPRAYRAFLKYVYTGALDYMLTGDLFDLYDIAKSYLETELVDMCTQMFENTLRPSNVASVYQKSIEHNFDELSMLFINFTGRNLEEVISSEGFASLSPEHAKNLVTFAVKFKNEIRRELESYIH